MTVIEKNASSATPASLDSRLVEVTSDLVISPVAVLKVRQLIADMEKASEELAQQLDNSFRAESHLAENNPAVCCLTEPMSIPIKALIFTGTVRCTIPSATRVRVLSSVPAAPSHPPHRWGACCTVPNHANCHGS